MTPREPRAYAALMLLACSVSACGVQAEKHLEQSEDAYRQCLLLYPRAPSSCDDLKKVYEQDKAAYDKASR